LTIHDETTAGHILQRHAPEDEFLQFIRALVAAGWLTEMDEVVYFLEKPWKYAGEFFAWDAAGRPMDDSEPGWSKFIETAQA